MKRLKYFQICFLWTLMLLAGCCILLHASENDPGLLKRKLDAVLENPVLFDYDLSAEIATEKNAVQVRRQEELNLLAAALIAYTEGQSGDAVKNLERLGESEFIAGLVAAHLDGGLDGLIHRCRMAPVADYHAAEIPVCSECGGTGYEICSNCRGVGTRLQPGTRRRKTCENCGGVGVTRCSACDGSLLRFTPQEPMCHDPAVEELILKVIYLKNNTPH